MRTFEYDLSKYDGVSGKLVLSAPTYRQRMKLIEKCNFQLGADGKATASGMQHLGSFNKLLDLVPPHFVEVKLEHKSGAKAKSFEEMEDYPVFDTLITEAASAVLSAGQLGN